MSVEVTEGGSGDLGALSLIDRSEEVRLAYRVVAGRLEPYPVEWTIPPWDAVGTGEHSVAIRAGFLMSVVERGGRVLTARLGGDVAGVAVVEAGFEPDLAWLTFLHVGRPFRRRGAASALWDAAAALAADAGASRVYVSATPTESAVGFYLSRGCVLADPPHPGLFDLEPEDVHLVAPLLRS